MFFYLRGKDIPQRNQRDKRISKLEGATVILSRDAPAILTVYRNRDRGLRHIKRKAKYSQAMEMPGAEQFEFAYAH